MHSSARQPKENTWLGLGEPQPFVIWRPSKNYRWTKRDRTIQHAPNPAEPVNRHRYHPCETAAGTHQQDLLEEGAAGGEDALVGADDGVVAGERHVQEGLPLQEAGEGVRQRLVVVVPLETELRWRGHGGRAGAVRRWGHTEGL